MLVKIKYALFKIYLIYVIQYLPSCVVLSPVPSPPQKKGKQKSKVLAGMNQYNFSHCKQPNKNQSDFSRHH